MPNSFLHAVGRIDYCQLRTPTTAYKCLKIRGVIWSVASANFCHVENSTIRGAISIYQCGIIERKVGKEGMLIIGPQAPCWGELVNNLDMEYKVWRKWGKGGSWNKLFKKCKEKHWRKFLEKRGQVNNRWKDEANTEKRRKTLSEAWQKEVRLVIDRGTFLGTGWEIVVLKTKRIQSFQYLLTVGS